MKIKEIRRTVSFGEFENISMTADVEPGEDPAAALLDLEAAIAHEIEKRKECRMIRYDIMELGRSKARLEDEVKEIENRLAVFDGWLEEIRIPF